MIQISIPEFTKVNYDEILHMQEDLSGVYVIYNKDNEVLYVGRTSHLKSRLKAHFSGNSNNTRDYRSIFFRCEFFYEESLLEAAIYELYLINTLYPKLNYTNVFTYTPPNPYEINRYKKKYGEDDNEIYRFFSCKGLTAAGSVCRRRPEINSNYCKAHRSQNVDAV